MGIARLILLEYSKRIKNDLFNRWRKEDPNITIQDVSEKMDDFRNIKDNLDEPDIMKYSWSELLDVTDNYLTQKELDTRGSMLKRKNRDKDVVFDEDGVVVFKGSDKEKCIKLSAGTSFCIGSQSPKHNAFDSYRKREGGTTVYFVFNTNLPEDHDFYVSVIYIYSNGSYTVTNAKNDGDIEAESWDDVNDIYIGGGFGDLPFGEDLIKHDPLDISELIDESLISVEGDTIVYNGNLDLSDMNLTSEDMKKLFDDMREKYSN